MTPEEYWSGRLPVILELQKCWMAERSVVAVLRLLMLKLDPSDDLGEVAFGVVGYMHDAFDISLGAAQRFSRWHVIGGDLSDEGIEDRIGTLTPRDLEF